MRTGVAMACADGSAIPKPAPHRPTPASGCRRWTRAAAARAGGRGRADGGPRATRPRGRAARARRHRRRWRWRRAAADRAAPSAPRPARPVAGAAELVREWRPLEAFLTEDCRRRLFDADGVWDYDDAHRRCLAGIPNWDVQVAGPGGGAVGAGGARGVDRPAADRLRRARRTGRRSSTRSATPDDLDARRRRAGRRPDHPCWRPSRAWPSTACRATRRCRASSSLRDRCRAGSTEARDRPRHAGARGAARRRRAGRGGGGLPGAPARRRRRRARSASPPTRPRRSARSSATCASRRTSTARTSAAPAATSTSSRNAGLPLSGARGVRAHRSSAPPTRP